IKLNINRFLKPNVLKGKIGYKYSLCLDPKFLKTGNFDPCSNHRLVSATHFRGTSGVRYIGRCKCTHYERPCSNRNWRVIKLCELSPGGTGQSLSRSRVVQSILVIIYSPGGTGPKCTRGTKYARITYPMSRRSRSRVFRFKMRL